MEYRQFDFSAKILHHREQIATFLAGGVPIPVNVEVDLTNGCNHRCQFCQWAGYLESERASLPSALVDRVLTELAGLGTRSINWTGGGEPLVHKGFPDLVRRAHGLGLENGLLTNGALIAPGLDDLLLDHLVWLRVSMAGGDRASYREVQGRDDFDRVLENLGRLSARRAQRSSGCTLGVAMLLKPATLHTLPAFTDTLIALGIDYLQVRPDMVADAGEQIWWRDVALPVCQAASRRAAGTGLAVLGARYLDAQAGVDYPGRCYAHYFVVAINAQGHLCFCKNTRDNPAFALGSLHERSFGEIWRDSDVVQKLRQHISPATCGTFCKNLDINVAMEDVVRGRAAPAAADAPVPVHVNFL